MKSPTNQTPEIAEPSDKAEAIRLAECLERDCEMNWPDYDNQMAAAALLRWFATTPAPEAQQAQSEGGANV